MIRTANRSQAALLEKYRVALEKAESIPRIAQAMEKTGYNTDILEEGKALLETTRKVYNKNLRLRADLALVRSDYAELRQQIENTYRDHRNKAILLYRRNMKMMDFLAISGEYPSQFDLRILTIRKLYTEIVNDPEIQQRFHRMKLSREDAEAALRNIGKLEGLYAECLKRKGLSEHSTEKKYLAFAELSDWMSDFYRAAKLALRKKPRLLAVIYKSA